jgi:phosphate transport system substrate-binding protein
MRSTTRRTSLLASAGLLAVAGLIATGCSSSSRSSSASTTAAAAAAASGSATTAGSGGGGGEPTGGTVPKGTINGSGSTFQLNFNQDAIQEFDSAHSGVTINYAGGGSGKGQSDLQHNLVQFAGTDSVVKNPTAFPGTILYFPTVAGPITVSYNLSGVSKPLTLTAATLAGIFSGAIKTWNAPQIAADNPGVSLPSTSITPVHRSDGSGTTSNFTLYLSKAAATAWTLGHGTTINWPGGQAAAGNPGVAQVIKQTSGAVGYVDYSTAVATGLTYASIKNSSGNVEAPTLAGATAAVEGAKINPNLTYDPTNSSNPDAYPITSPTWVIAYKGMPNTTDAAILKGWLDFCLTTAQTSVAPKDNYAALPPSLAQMAISQLSQL